MALFLFKSSRRAGGSTLSWRKEEERPRLGVVLAEWTLLGTWTPPRCPVLDLTPSLLAIGGDPDPVFLCSGD